MQRDTYLPCHLSGSVRRPPRPALQVLAEVGGTRAQWAGLGRVQSTRCGPGFGVLLPARTRMAFRAAGSALSVARQRPPPPGAPPTTETRPPHRPPAPIAPPLGSRRRPLAVSAGLRGLSQPRRRELVARRPRLRELVNASPRQTLGADGGRDTKTTESLVVLGGLPWRREGAFVSILDVFSRDLCAFPLLGHVPPSSRFCM